MKSHNVADLCKNAVGTVFLLAGAFFVCSTLVSMRAVFADPIAPVMNDPVATTPSPRANTSRTSGRATNPRANATVVSAPANATVARTTASNAAAARSVATRGTTARAAARTNTAASRTPAATARNVAQRASTPTRTTTAANRAVRARVSTTQNGTTAARISLSGSAIRGSKASTSTYTYLSNKLYTGNYSNIIDPQTGLISADAYNNCMESYYTCMDEICTARNAAQGRCSCAARVTAFKEAQDALDKSNEELIKVAGELSLLVATKGKDVSSAFKLTDAEKIMNCASYAEIVAGGDEKKINEWCDAHKEYSNTNITVCSKTQQPTYCKTMGDQYGFSLNDFSTGSDIMAAITSYADAKTNAANLVKQNDYNLLSNAEIVSDIVAGMTQNPTAENAKSLDALANTWGYDLFAYAHNNVCGRVLDSCFNGIYETCGTPITGKCASTTGTSTSRCAYNYNSKIEVSSNGDVKLNERGNTVVTDTAACLGYTSTSGDPYSTLRGPVADARRSIMQKYLLDANAACDAYSEQLTTAAQNVSYQKAAAQQALQQKRLEFEQEEVAQINTNYKGAINNFNNCLAELFDCYTQQAANNKNWSTSRIKAYCVQINNSPSCYETMICSAPNNELQAVIDVKDEPTKTCENTASAKTNTCRNVITLSEILSASFAAGALDGSSTKLREDCLQRNGISGVRSWSTSNDDDKDSTGWLASCSDDYHSESGACVSNTRTCTITGDANAIGTQTWNSNAWGACTRAGCKSGYHQESDGGKCLSNIKACNYTADANAYRGEMTWVSTANTWSACQLAECNSGYRIVGGVCTLINPPATPDDASGTDTKTDNAE